MQKIPELRQHGIGTTAIAYLMATPHRGHRSAERYKSFIDARVPGKDNSYREDHPDQHYLFARVAYRREFAQMFQNECAVFLCDDMNKLKVGPLAVSRYHQISRIFPVDDKPQYLDHDFPHPGYLLIPSQPVDSNEKSWYDHFEVTENDMTTPPAVEVHTDSSTEQATDNIPKNDFYYFCYYSFTWILINNKV